MSSRHLAAALASTLLAGLGGLAPVASASPARTSKALHLVALKPCSAVLAPADFKDELEEVSASPASQDFQTSSCKFAGLAADGPAGGTRLFTEGQIGTECIANVLRLSEAGIAAPKGGCYRISSATLVVARGHAVERQIEKLIKAHHRPAPARHWPAGFTRAVLHGVGSRAEFGFSGESGYGYLEVLNAQMTIEFTEGGSMVQLLKDAASKL